MIRSYENLVEHFHRISNLENARSILQWDEAVMMPSGSGPQRNRAVAELASLMQSLTIDPKVGDWINETSAREAELNEWEKANLREMKRLYTEATAIPNDLLKHLVMARMNCEQNWRTLRPENNWKAFQPYLAEVLSLTREMIQGLAAIYNVPIYDAALSLYSPGLTTRVVETLFADLKSFLPQLIVQAVEKQTQDYVLEPKGKFPQEAQRALGLELMKHLRFNFDLGRVDVSHHPFCGGTTRDVRITTRYAETDFTSALMGILHETGHALYEQGLPDEWLGQPVGAAAGMSLHESQSLLTEMQICRSREFLSFAAPLIKKHLGSFVEDQRSLEPDNLFQYSTRVRPGFIRVDADEVTYPCHVILRFEIERALLEKKLDLSDLPEAWNEKMLAYLNLSTKGNDRDGCMQDVHWPSGAFGYFPAYTFGAVIAAQLFAKMRATLTDVKKDINHGNFHRLQHWLSENIWKNASRLRTLDLVKAVSGELSAEPFRKHLEERYLRS